MFCNDRTIGVELDEIRIVGLFQYTKNGTFHRGLWKVDVYLSIRLGLANLVVYYLPDYRGRIRFAN